ncbi:ATP-binding protein [Paenibacillus sp. OV219]|uniref:ATP-binding protein n=1 Tax=Paenibacillus sp. OV219 TaxID=1884377 RepID=UPI0008AE71BA|nr:ATP-binding protein [Paenibacillus sp. OV219]SEO16904.1 two-component system, sporulation sensor kinase A [Paenibacillus sp. OV219]
MRRKARAIYCNQTLAERTKRKLTLTSQERDNDASYSVALSYQRLIKYLPEPIFVHDGIEVLFANQAGLRLLGMTELSEIMDEVKIWKFMHPDNQVRSMERIRAVMQTDEPNEFEECRLIDVSGEVIDVEVSSTRIHNYPGRGTVVQSVFRDIRGRKKEEEALIHSEKLSVAGQMAAGIAHEIRNPLTSLIGFSKFLKTKIDKYHEYFDIMLVELDRINSIVQEFMALAKPQASQFRKHDLNRIIGNVLTLLETQAILKDVQIIPQLDSEVTELLCDENQLKQVFVNVLKNAIEAMPSGGIITITLTNVDAQQIAVSIIDEGTGIPEEQLPKLGGPFFTTKDSGTGLGLMICYRIIEGHQGKMDIKSMPGKGTTVAIRLPRNL